MKDKESDTNTDDENGIPELETRIPPKGLSEKEYNFWMRGVQKEANDLDKPIIVIEEKFRETKDAEYYKAIMVNPKEKKNSK